MSVDYRLPLNGIPEVKFVLAETEKIKSSDCAHATA